MGPIDPVQQEGPSCDQVSAASAGKDGRRGKAWGELPYRIETVCSLEGASKGAQELKSSCELISVWDWHLDFRRLWFILQKTLIPSCLASQPV